MLFGLSALLPTACGGDASSSSPTASSAPSEAAPAVSVHPVLGSGPCGGGDTAALADRTRERCYELGPAFVLQGDLVNPRVDYVDDTFSVVVEIAAGARSRAEAGFVACRDGAATCPAADGEHGAAAIVIDRVVESAPVIESAEVVESGLVLRGGLTEDDAYRIVDSLSR